jgi:hypothetical protein
VRRPAPSADRPRWTTTVRTDSEAVASLLGRIAGEAASQVFIDPTDVVDIPAQLDRAAKLQAKWGTAVVLTEKFVSFIQAGAYKRRGPE